jgi:hypothetical protein
MTTDVTLAETQWKDAADILTMTTTLELFEGSFVNTATGQRVA